MSLLERVVQVHGRLLRADRARDASQGVLLTFDVGRLWVRPDADGAELLVTQVDSGDAVPGGLEDACEEEPWWRILGDELTRTSELDGHGVRLQFRADAENPRVVRVEPRGLDGGLAVTLESTAH